MSPVAVRLTRPPAHGRERNHTGKSEDFDGSKQVRHGHSPAAVAHAARDSALPAEDRGFGRSNPDCRPPGSQLQPGPSSAISNELSVEFPLQSDERERPYGWSWEKSAPAFDLPNLSNQEALAFAMIERYLRPLLPHALVDQLNPYFDRAKKRLGAEAPTRGSRSWLGKVAVVQPTQNLIPPKVDATVHAAVTDALLLDRRLRICLSPQGRAGGQGVRPQPARLGPARSHDLCGRRAVGVRGRTHLCTASNPEGNDARPRGEAAEGVLARGQDRVRDAAFWRRRLDSARGDL